MEVLITIAIFAAITWVAYKNYGQKATEADHSLSLDKPAPPPKQPDWRSWSRFSEKLDRIRTEIGSLEYPSVFTTEALHKSRELASVLHHYGVPSTALAMEQVGFILSENALKAPHGLDLLRVFPEPDFPTLPQMPDTSVTTAREEEYIALYHKLRADIEIARGEFIEKAENEKQLVADLTTKLETGDWEALKVLLMATLVRHPLPEVLRGGIDFSYDADARVILCTIEVPDFSKLLLLNKRANSGSAKWLPVSETEKKRSSERILHSLCVRAAYLVAMSDPTNLFDTVAVNARQSWFDPATGAPREGIVASMQALKTEVRELQPGRLDAKACFRHLAGISTPNATDAVPIRPIFVMNTEDSRIVPNRDVASGLDEESNLATMPWEDFEHLVRQLFEWMFTNDGVEVKVTRASRDRGVDAIMFDPDPVRGGKYILQAKRYTRTVDVAAVRDLYGTIVNEGANRGILVTTATFGPDAYEFAKNKPISLIDGPNLIAHLRKHGRHYRINLDEARRIESEQRVSETGSSPSTDL